MHTTPPCSAPPPRVLLIEDDVRLAWEVARFLHRHGFKVHTLHRGEQAVRAASSADVVVLDWMLPGLDGLSVCRAIRADHPLPILMLTAREGDASEVHALEEGADDYLSKPVRPAVLLARIRALLRRASSPSRAGTAEAPLRVGALEMHPRRREAHHKGVALMLTDAEYTLLHLLATQAGTVVSRDALCMALSGRSYDGLDRSVDQYISRLRRKLGDSGRAPRVIKTVRGEGYLLAGTVQR